MTKEQIKIIEKLLKEIQLILVDDDFIPIHSAKKINNNINSIKAIIKTQKD